MDWEQEKARHYALIRSNLLYRMQFVVDDLAMSHEAAWEVSEPRVKEIIQYRHVNTNDMMEQTLGMSNYVNDKLKEHLAWHKKKNAPSPFSEK